MGTPVGQEGKRGAPGRNEVDIAMELGEDGGRLTSKWGFQMKWLPFLLPMAGLWMLVSGWRGLFAAWRSNRAPKEGGAGPLADATPGPQARQRFGSAARVKCLAMAAAGVALMWWSGFSAGIRPGASTWSQDPGLPESLAADTKLLCQDFLRETRAPGMVAVVVAGGNSATLAMGKTGLWGRPATEQTLFEIGSVTKVFTGILLASAVEQGKVRLDQPVVELMREVAEIDPRVTLERLASHTAAMPRLPENMGTLPGALRMLTGGNPYQNYGEREFHEALRGLKLLGAPGAENNYSNYGVALLGHALAKARGLSFAELLQTDLLDPMGLADTSLALGPARKARFSQGHTTAAGLGPISIAMKSDPWDLADCLAPAGGVRSSGADLRRFLRVCMGLEQTSISNAVKISTLALSRKSERREVGLGWYRTIDKELRQTIVWHNGGTGGFQAHLSFTEDRQAGVVILCNASVDVDQLGFRLLRVARTKAN